MLMLLLSEKLTEDKFENKAEVSEEIKKIRDEILSEISKDKEYKEENEVI